MLANGGCINILYLNILDQNRSTDFGDFRIRYQATDFNGPIVTHCHFLPHEDEGMIVYFQVVECEEKSNRPFVDVKNGTLNPFGWDPTANVPEQCDIFRDRGA